MPPFCLTAVRWRTHKGNKQCKSAREQSSELMGYVRELTIVGLMDEKPMMIWAAHYLSALAKALMDDAELGMMC
ncbi:DUF3077 domain-containing protein [Pseudomonas sp. C5pp]|uniref:DUF3077 domain-containing protein n=1 Tax=Pseudomonas sp. C5pp TaxID=1586081 RepID=UPI00068A6ED4|nr:DUF3077 domain-containing protein [Pseudomonas sp. C5pp]